MIFTLVERAANLGRRQKVAAVVLSDAALCVVSVVIALGLRVGIFRIWNNAIADLSLISVALFLPIFLLTGVYRVVFRYAGRGMVTAVLRALLYYSLIFATIVTFYSLEGVPRTAGVIQPIIFGGLVIISRLTIRYVMVDLLGQMRFVGESRVMLVYGAGSAGIQVAASLANDPGIRLVGFIDDDLRLRGHRVDGHLVYSPSEIGQAISKHSVTHILLALPSLGRRARSRIVDMLEPFPVHVLTLPNLRDMVDGRVSISDIHELDIEDLLGREPVIPNSLLLGRTTVNKTVLVTGAGGSIGSELCRQIAEIGARRLILFEHNEFALYAVEKELAELSRSGLTSTEIIPILGSVRDEERVREIFDLLTPETVFHAAAYKHVPLVEANPVEAVQNNIAGTRIVADCAQAAGISDFILVSTDKAVRPTNIMGATKRAAEQIVQMLAADAAQTRFSIVRFGNVLGSSGSVVPLFRQQIASGGPITLTHREVTRYFMTISEAAALVIQAAGMARGGEVFVLDMGEPVRIYDLARKMIRLSGLQLADNESAAGDIEVLEVGLRPGEKLFEELLIGDNPMPTRHERIMMAREDFLPKAQLAARLERLLLARDAVEVLHGLKELVPEFDHTPRWAPESDDAPTDRSHYR